MAPILKNQLRYLAAAALLAGSSALCIVNGVAEDIVVEFDPARTKVEFTLADVLHTVHGEFKLTKGSLTFDRETGAASGTLVIDATSGNSGNSARDSRMHKNILESQKFPEITFVPQRVKGQFAPHGESRIEVEGTFTIHGVGHPLALATKVNAKDGQVYAVTHFVVPYVEWGMKNPSTFILRVSDKVDIDIHAAGRVVGGKE
jgi:polyisoprenoid-binding protein YceI